MAHVTVTLLLLTLMHVTHAAAPVQAQPATVFNESMLEPLLDSIRLFNEVLKHGLDDSSARLAERLPSMWHELEAMELKLKHQLPLLREQLRQFERALREFAPRVSPPGRPSMSAPLIAV